MQDNGLSKARRAWIATLLVGAAIMAGYGCVRFWPVTTITIDPLQTPFYGPYQANGFVHPSDSRYPRAAACPQVDRRRDRAGRSPVLVPMVGNGLGPARVEVHQAVVAHRRRVRRVAGGLVLLALLAVLLAKEIPSLHKTPDFHTRPGRHALIICILR